MQGLRTNDPSYTTSVRFVVPCNNLDSVLPTNCFHGRVTIPHPPVIFDIGTNAAPAAKFRPIPRFNILVPKEPTTISTCSVLNS